MRRPRFYPANPADQFAMGIYFNSDPFKDAFAMVIVSQQIAEREDAELARRYAAAAVPPLPGVDRDDAAVRAELDLLDLEIDVLHAAADGYAGNLLIQLDDLLQSYGRRIAVTPLGLQSTFGPATRGISFSAALNAGANNYRHGRAWHDLPFPYTRRGRADKAFDSISTVQRVLGRSDRLEEHITASLLREVSSDSYTQLIEAFIEAASAMALSRSHAMQANLHESLTRANHLAADRAHRRYTVP